MRIILFILTIAPIILFSQNVGINTDGSSPDPSAILDVKSTTQGMLVPRMDSSQRNLINNPAIGLLIFDTSLEAFHFFNGSDWVDLSVAKKLEDSDGDTRIEVEKFPYLNNIIFTTYGNEFARMDNQTLHISGQGKGTYIGHDAGNNAYTLGDNWNSYIGYSTGANAETGKFNTAVGALAGSDNLSGSENTYLGVSAGYQNFGSNNTLLGRDAGRLSGSSNDNTYLGHDAGRSASGSGNLFLGKSAGENESGSNKLILANNSTTPPLIYGEFDNNYLMLNGTLETNEKLFVGHMDSTLGSGQVVMRNADGELVQQSSCSLAVPTTGIVYSDTYPNTELESAGFTYFGYYDRIITHAAVDSFAYGSWDSISNINSPLNSAMGTAVWTGTEMLVWGGIHAVASNSGGKYNPVTNSWDTISTINAPLARSNHSAGWTGDKMIIWGGTDISYTLLNNGDIYDPVSDSWDSLTTVNAPTHNVASKAIVTDSLLFVYYEYPVNEAYKYNLITKSWTAASTIGGPPTNSVLSKTLLWTGSEVVVFGDGVFSGEPSCTYNGHSHSAYNPATDSWSFIGSTYGAFGGAKTVWADTTIYSFGGRRTNFTLDCNIFNDCDCDPNGSSYDGGWKYDPPTGLWNSYSLGIGSKADYHLMFWTGTEVLVWGGLASISGAKYHPTQGGLLMDENNGPVSNNDGYVGVWTGTELLVWNKTEGGFRYNPNTLDLEPEVTSNTTFHLYKKDACD